MVYIKKIQKMYKKQRCWRGGFVMRVSTQSTTSANSSNINYESLTKGNNSMVVIIQLEMPLSQNYPKPEPPTANAVSTCLAWNYGTDYYVKFKTAVSREPYTNMRVLNILFKYTVLIGFVYIIFLLLCILCIYLLSSFFTYIYIFIYIYIYIIYINISCWLMCEWFGHRK